MGLRLAGAALAVVAASAKSSPARDLAFGLVVGGMFGFWLGAANFVARRFAERRWGALGSARAIWFKAGFFFAPNWLSRAVALVGIALLLAGAAIWAVWSMTS